MMKKQYEAPVIKATLFVSTEELAFTFDELENVGQGTQKPGKPTDISGGDVLVPLG